MTFGLLYSLVIMLTLPSCQIHKKSFEGIITYKTAIRFKKEQVEHRGYYEQKFGDTLKIYYDEKGDILKKFLHSGDSGYVFNLYLNYNHHYYAQWKHLDTIYHYDASKQELELIKETTGKAEKILGHNCESIGFESVEPITGQHVTQRYSYCGYPYLDPALFHNFRDYYTDIVTEKAKSAFLKMELDLGDFVVTYTAIKIEPQKLNPDLFKLPDNVPQQEL